MSDDKPFDGEGYTIKDLLEKGLNFWKKDEVQSFVATTEEVISIIQTLREGKSSSWKIGGSAIRLTSEILEFYEDLSPKQAKSPVWKRFLEIDRYGKVVLLDFLTGLFLPYLDSNKMEILEEDETNSLSKYTNSNEAANKVALYRYKVEEGLPLYWIDNGFEATNVVCPEGHDAEKASKVISDRVWDKYDDHIEINVNDQKEFEFKAKSPLPWNYEGSQGPRLLGRWKKFYKKGIRRSVILHGPPGTGKSTLARQTAKEINGRVLFVPVRMLMALNNLNYFMATVEVLQPDLLIVDDIDRLSQHELDLLLSFFEETENPVPFLIATTNHLNRLPDAIKRPGRFDEIWRIDPPDDEIRIRVIRYLAKLEGLELTDAQAEKLSDIGSERNLPGSHIREIIRRVAVLGWDELNFTEDDLTFRPEWNKSKDSMHSDSHFPRRRGQSDYYNSGEVVMDNTLEEVYGSTLHTDDSGYMTWADIKFNKANEDGSE